MSCVQHDVQEPQSASPSMTTFTSPPIRWLQRDRRGLRHGGLHVALDRDAARRELLVDAVEEHVAARLGDVEQPDGQPLQAFGSR